MKSIKIIFLLLFLFILSGNVKAESYKLNLVIENDKRILKVTDDNNTYSYKDVIDKYNLDHYYKFYFGEDVIYFLDGFEISEGEYIIGSSSEEADERCLDIGDACKRVHNTLELIQSIKDIYNEKQNIIYHLVYSTYEYNNSIDFTSVEEYINMNYIHDTNKNMYKYDEYAYYGSIKFLPSYNEEEMIIDFFDIKITKEEEKAVNKFLDYFIPIFDGKSDYEKIVGVYNYLSNTAKYVEDDGYKNHLDAKLSAYDVLLKKEYVCIGMATTFQLLMEELGIESYIVDQLYITDEIKGSIHTYNVVNLNDKWYIVDVTNNLSGLLISDENYNNEYYYDININDISYLEEYAGINTSYEFDYKEIDNVISSILISKIKIEHLEIKKEEIEKVNEWSYIILCLILVVISIVIILFTKK